MNPYWPYGAPAPAPAAPGAPPAGPGAPAYPGGTVIQPPTLSIDETIRAIKTTDELLSGFRSDLDNAARGRRYGDIQKLATAIQEAAKVGQQRTGELEQLQAARKR